MIRQVILGIQYISIFGLLFECWVIFRRWQSKLHSYLFLSCVATLVNNLGYLVQMTSTTEEAYLGGLQMAYLGKVWIPFSLFLFAIRLCKVRISKWVEFVLSFIHMITFGMILLLKNNSLYYTNVSYTQDGLFPQLVHGSGVWHYFYNVLLLVYIVYALVQMYLTWHKENDPLVKKRMLMIIFAFLAESFFFGIYKLNRTQGYDVTVLGYTIGMIFMYIAIFRYDLLNTEDLARDYVVDELSEGIVAVDQNGQVSYFNKPAAALFPALTTDTEAVVRTLRSSIEQNTPLKFDDKVYTPSVNVLYNGDTPSGMIYVLSDDTEHFRYIEELEEQTRRADSASKAKSSFLANMSHEIRTPINAILGMDEMILRESAEKSAIAYAEDIESAGRTLLSIINDILDLSKIEEGKMEILSAHYDLSSLINDLVNMTRTRAEDKGLRFDVHVDETTPCLLVGDEIRVRQCAINILTNAVKYTEKGSITLTVGYEKRSEESIALQFSVADTGIGMKPEDMEKLFSPFERIEEARNHGVEGTGLGMSITKQLLALMGSTLNVESVYGKGSTFSFAVEQPVVKWNGVGQFTERLRAGTQHKSYREMFHAPDARVLVVDDTPVNLTVMRGLLKRTRVQLDTAESGREALELAKERRYDAVFIDHMMPEMDGIETLHELQKLPGMADVPCIALTANAISGAREMYLKCGFSYYLSKPVDGAKLEKILMAFLPREKIFSADDAAPEVPAVTLPRWLHTVDGLDAEAGLRHCGSEEVYLETLTIYAKNVASSADELIRYRDANDPKNVTVKVHALKSTSRAIGAETLGALAAKLELAGNAGDTQTLFGGLDDLLAHYRALGEALAPLYRTKTADGGAALPPITDDKLREAYDALRKAAVDMDSESAEHTLRYLGGVRLSDAEHERVEQLRRAVANFDWDQIDGILR